MLLALVAAAFIGYNGQPYAGLELVNELSGPLSDVAFSASVGTPSCLAVKGSYAFVVGDPYRSLAIVDISDRASPTVVGAIRSPYVLAIDYRDSVITEKGCDATAIGEGRGCSVVVADDLNTVYITSYECNGGYSVDTSDKTNPTFTAGDRSIGVISGPVAMVNKHVDGGGDYLFIAANGGNTEMAHGLVVLDFTRGQTAIALGDEGNTAVVDELQSHGATAVALNYDATRAYVTSNVRDGSLFIYDVSKPMVPERISILFRSSLSGAIGFDTS